MLGLRWRGPSGSGFSITGGASGNGTGLVSGGFHVGSGSGNDGRAMAPKSESHREHAEVGAIAPGAVSGIGGCPPVDVGDRVVN